MARSALFVRKQSGGMFAIEDESRSTGSRFYVDSATGTDGAGYGQNPDSPCATIDYAVALCTANKGDIIYVMPGHAETINAASAIDLDVAGITVIGLGNGEDRPTITIGSSEDASTVEIGAADVKIKNLILQPGNDGVDILLDINADGAIIEDCELRSDETNAYQADTYIDIDGGANGADRTVIRGCKITSITAGAAQAINIGAVEDALVIEDNWIDGDFSAAGILSGSIFTAALIRRNAVSNRAAGVHAIEFTAACTGLLVDNRLYSSTLGTILDPGSLKCLGNLETDAIDQAGVDSPRTSAGGLAADSITAAVIATDAIDADAMADGAITAATFAAGAIDAAAIANSAIDANTFAAGAIDAAAIAAAAIDAATFAADALQAIQDEVQDAIQGEQLDHLTTVAVANNADMTVEVADGTILSNVMTKTGDTSDFVPATDSLEGLADTLGTPAGASLAADVAAVQTEVNKIDGLSMDAAPVAGSLARFVASGGTALGTELPDSKSLVDLLMVQSATGEADIDISAADYTSLQPLLTIEPAAGSPLEGVVVVIDCNKAATGFIAQHAAQTIQFVVQRKVDGTNWTGDEATVAVAANAMGDQTAKKLDLGPVGVTEDVRIGVKLSAENAVDVEFPYVVYYKAKAAPTVTPVAAA